MDQNGDVQSGSKELEWSQSHSPFQILLFTREKIHSPSIEYSFMWGPRIRRQIDVAQQIPAEAS